MVLITQSTRIRVRSATHRGDHILWNSSNRWRLGVVGEVAGDPLAIRLSPPVICPSSRALVFLSTPSASVFNPYHQISPPPRGAIIWQFARIPPSTLKSYSASEVSAQHPELRVEELGMENSANTCSMPFEFTWCLRQSAPANSSLLSDPLPLPFM
ncbi:uncharacterized protein LOC120693979 isoform X1 [Panicum virgatum]|uniref:uncharacterized protein LOC120693979 isoform X1 n=1 Tax=Panicum virgatum TaxID=38727 RepID=UPI0019D61443|nr:uncharacterized protein LOC120693979 isoform X1 [Panicum virgatum]